MPLKDADVDVGPRLTARAALSTELATQVTHAATDPATPTGVRQGQARSAADVLVDVALWRAGPGR